MGRKSCVVGNASGTGVEKKREKVPKFFTGLSDLMKAPQLL